MEMHDSLVRSILGLSDEVVIEERHRKLAERMEDAAEKLYYKQHPELNP